MSYLLNYKNWRALYENTSSNSATEFTPPTAIELGGSLPVWPVYIAKDTEFEKLNSWEGQLSKIFGKTGIPYSNSKSTATGTAVERELSSQLLAAAYASLDKKNRPKTFAEFIKWLSDDKNWTDFGIKVGTPEQVDYTKKSNGMATLGKIETDSTGDILGWEEEERGKLQGNNVVYVARYLNGYNLANCAAASWKQYDFASCIDDNTKAFTAFKATTEIKNKVVLYTTNVIAETAGGKESTTTTTGGAAAQTGGTEIMFKQGSSDVDKAGVKIDGNHPKVKEIGDAILGYIGEQGVLDSMTLTSSASPEWNGGETMDSYKGKVTSGTGVPAAGTDFAALNAKLAYDRGVAFQNALIAYLGGHVKANSIQVGWKISTDAPGNGRNVTYNIKTKSVSPTPVTKTTFMSGSQTSQNLMGQGKLAKYTITWNVPAKFTSSEEQGAAASAKELAELYPTLKAGEEILVYDKKGNEAKLKITEIIDGKPSFTRADGTKATIELEKKEGVTSFKGLTLATKTARLSSNAVKAVTKKPTESDI
jgi:hypothetical protein